MSVQKTTPTKLKKSGRGYTVLPTDVINLIRSAEALAIWCYLQSKPEDWVVRKMDIMNRLAIGKRRYAAGMLELKDLGLLQTVVEQGENGQLLGKTLICFNTPTEVPKMGISVATEVPVIDLSQNGKDAQWAHIQIKDGLKRKDNTKAAPERFHPSHKPFPDQNTPTPQPDNTDWRDVMVASQMKTLADA